MRPIRIRYVVGVLAALATTLSLVLAAVPVGATPPGSPATYTLDADFDQGTLAGVNHDAPNNNQLQLNGQGQPFGFIWIAASGRGTIIKINTDTGAILGEYWSAPQNMAHNPSRTTVDANGNVWSGNRDEQSNFTGGPTGDGSVVQIGLLENGQCVDKNGNGVIDTSTGLGDIKPWPNASLVDTDGGVETAADECIIKFVRLPDSPQARHISVDAGNNIWVAGYDFVPRIFYKLNGATGAIMDSFNAGAVNAYGGYGGLIDANGILWSAAISQNTLLRLNPVSKAFTNIPVYGSYGLGRDTAGNVWNAMYYTGQVDKFDPAGVLQAGFPKATNGNNPRGVVVTPADNNVWVANSGSSSVARLDNAGNFIKLIPVGSMPTGVAVDRMGKVWVTNYNSNNAMRINPTGGGDGLGAVDLTVNLGAGAAPYNYSDMTGSLVPAPPSTGTWTIVHDSLINNAEWGVVSWNALMPGDSSLVVTAASSNDGVTFSAPQPVTNGADLSVPNGRYLKVVVTFNRASTGESPILYDLSLAVTMVRVSKDYRYTNVCFERDNDNDGRFTEDPAEPRLDNDADGRFDEDPVDGIDNDGDLRIDEDPSEQVDNDGDGLLNEDGIDCPGGTSLGTPLPRDGAGVYTLEAVVKKDGTVSSYNPGQYYAVSTVEVVTPIPNLTIDELFGLCTETLPGNPGPISALNPAWGMEQETGGGSVVIVVVGPDGVARQVFDATSPNVTITDNVKPGPPGILQPGPNGVPDDAHAFVPPRVPGQLIPAGIKVMMYVKFSPGLKDKQFAAIGPVVNSNLARVSGFLFPRATALLKLVRK